MMFPCTRYCAQPRFLLVSLERCACTAAWLEFMVLRDAPEHTPSFLLDVNARSHKVGQRGAFSLRPSTALSTAALSSACVRMHLQLVIPTFEISQANKITRPHILGYI